MAPPIVVSPVRQNPETFGLGELSISSKLLSITPPHDAAGVLGLIGSEDQVNAQKAAGPMSDAAVVAYTQTEFDAVYAEGLGNGVRAISHSANANEAAIYATNDKGGPAGRFEGKVYVSGGMNVSGDITLTGADCAEDFDVADGAMREPGTVMVMNDEGQLVPCSKAYDRRVAGVISGAGEYRPALVLDKRGETPNRSPLALFGKAFCLVDAGFGRIDVGDLLTTSPRAGHAMKATDAVQAFGAVVGKALRPVADGVGLVPILVTLQ